MRPSAPAGAAGATGAEAGCDGEVMAEPDPRTFSYHRDAEGHLHLFI
jgi:hypothetical protein